MQYIDKKDWKVCKICGYISKGGGNKYFSEDFIRHIKNHNKSLEEYFVEYCDFKLGTCPCGICHKKLKIIRRGANFRESKWSCGRNDGQREWSENAKISRIGKGNPMFEKPPWNLGLNKETSSSVKIAAEKRIGRVTSEESKIKQSISAKKRLVHGHTGRKHSQEAKEKMRQITLLRIKRGDFKQNDTVPVRAVKAILEKNNIKYIQEKIVEYYSFDLYLIDYNVYIEVDGDYWHSNPKFYPNGPKTKTQKINKYRDDKKNIYCNKNNIKLLRLWENDIFNSPEEVLRCILKKLSE